MISEKDLLDKDRAMDLSNQSNGNGDKQLSSENVKQKLKIEDLNSVEFENEPSLAIDWNCDSNFLTKNGKYFIYTKLTEDRKISIYDV